MAIDSLGSATNSNFQSGPSINATGRSDVNTASGLAQSAYKPSDTSLDVFRHELLLSKRSAQNHAYINVISRDSIPTDTHSISVSYIPVLVSTMLHLEPNTSIDMSISNYYSEMGDARTDFEFFMAENQISLHSDIPDTEKALKLLQPNLADGMRKRNAICFMKDKDTSYDITNFKMQSIGGSNIFYERIDDTNKASSLSGEANFHKAKTVFIDTKHADYTPMVLTKNSVKQMILQAVSYIVPNNMKYSPVVVTARHTSSLVAPELRYAGVALTDACMHASRGDTAVTVNHFSALTTQNGPFDVYVGDDLGWIFNVEKKDWSSDGNRRFRNVMDVNNLHNVLANDSYTVVFTAILLENSTKFKQAKFSDDSKAHASGSARIGNLKDTDSEARGSIPKFVIVPLKHGSKISKTSSIMDHRRRIGKAISSSKSHARLDWINGCSSEM